MKKLTSNSWPQVAQKIRLCHIYTLSGDQNVTSWNEAFDFLVDTIREERKANPVFATELYHLTEDTGFSYDFKDIFEEYFDYLENNKNYELVIKSANEILNLFAWNNSKPSLYKYRIGNALEELNKTEEALEFGKKWLAEDPKDLYAAASLSFLLVTMGKNKEAADIAKKYLPDELISDDNTETIFMAATRLFEMTNDSKAKERIAKKIAAYTELTKANEHHHVHNKPANLEEAIKLLEYMKKHNDDHAHELEHLNEDLASFGKDSSKLDEAIKAYKNANALLADAIKQIEKK